MLNIKATMEVPILVSVITQMEILAQTLLKSIISTK